MTHPAEPKSIAVDFDETLVSSTFPVIHGLKPGAKEALQAFRDMGYKIIISSCRSCGWNWECYYCDAPFTHATERDIHKAMVKFLDDNQVPYDEIDTGDKGKISAAFMVDDKGVRFENNWPEIVEFVRSKT
jgi:hypothetical protein